jgi:hypothetical protein
MGVDSHRTVPSIIVLTIDPAISSGMATRSRDAGPMWRMAVRQLTLAPKWHSHALVPGFKWRTVSTGEPVVDPAPTDENVDPPQTYTAEDLANMDAKDLSELVGTGPVQKVMQREKETGRRSAERSFLESLGFTNMEEAKSWTAQKREEDTAKLSDAERRQREADNAAATAEAARREAAADRQAAKVERLLTRAGVGESSMNDAMRLVAVEPDADEATVTEAVEALKGRLPALFASNTPTAPPAPSGSPGGTPPRPTPSGDSYQRGVERAKAYSGITG